MGQPVFQPVGSRAVRNFIEETQPLLAICGHVHEGRGSTKLGATVCVNPGSLYTNGILLGCVVNIQGEQIRSIEFTEG